MAYMVAAYLVIWLVSFVLIFSMVQRQRALQREIDRLKEMTRDGQPAGDGRVEGRRAEALGR